MVTKSEVIIGFINQAACPNVPTLAVLFIKRSEIVDDVLKEINYNDDDLMDLIIYRPELAESPENFFKVIDKIKKIRKSRGAIKWGVIETVRCQEA